jgi:hypothetical protein
MNLVSVNKATLKLVGVGRLAEKARRAAQQATPTIDMTVVSDFIFMI